MIQVLALSSILVYWLCLELFFSFSFHPVSSVSQDGIFSVSLVLVVVAVRSIALFREDGGGDLLFCAVVLRCGGSLLAGTVVGCVYCMYIGSFQLLVLFTGGVELCSEEMTDNQGEL